MNAVTSSSWERLDPAERRRLDAQFLAELTSWSEPGLDDGALQEYLDYRHERPTATITTYEEGQIRRLLHRRADPSAEPDPVEAEEHTDPLERFGAQRLHLTNAQTYIAVMLGLNLLLLLALLIWVI